MTGILAPLADNLFALIGRHPVLSLVAFPVMLLGPWLVWRSRSKGRHRGSGRWRR